MLGQRKLLQRLVPGLMHAFIFWGFLVLFPTIVLAAIAAAGGHVATPEWYRLLSDLFACLVLAGVVTAFVIRKVVRPARFKGSHLGEADLILAMIALVVLTLLGWHRDRRQVLRLGASRRHRRVPRVSAVLEAPAHRDRGGERLVRAHARARPLEPLRFDVPDAELRFGAATVFDLTRKEVLDGFSCTECGRCQDACPAYATGKILSPKLLIMGIRDQVFAQSTEPIVGNGVPEQSIWDCVTCGACVEACPVSIEHIDHIVDLRRSRVMVDSKFPAEAEPMLRDVERASNPWGKPQTERAAWAESLGVRVLEPGDPAPEYLYWVGCAASFDERAKKSAESTAKLLQKAGVDFAILGPREACTGDPARRMGNEYVFQAYAEQNVSTLNEQGVTKIVASCPHCFNTLANEYGDFGGNYEVAAPHGAARGARRRRPAAAGGGRAVDHVPRQLLSRAAQRRADAAAEAPERDRPAGRDEAERQADVLLRRRRRAHVDGGDRHADQPRARERGRGDRRRDARGRVPVLHGDARRRRARDRRGDAGCGRLDAARRIPGMTRRHAWSSSRPTRIRFSRSSGRSRGCPC